MAEEQPLPLKYMLFKTPPVEVITSYSNHRDYPMVTETGKMLRDAVGYGLYNHINWTFKRGEHSQEYQLRVVGPSSKLGEKIGNQQKLQVETVYYSGQAQMMGIELLGGIPSQEVPSAPEQIESLIFKHFLNKVAVSIILERRVFNPESLDLEAFAEQITPLADYLELMYENLSLPLVDPVRNYLTSIGKDEARHLEEMDINDTPVPLLNGRFPVDGDSETAQAELERVLDLGTTSPKLDPRKTMPGMPTIVIGQKK